MNLSAALTMTATGLLFLALSVPVHGADDCADWQLTYATYEDEVSQAIRDEPEDLPRELRRHADAMARGASDHAKKIDTKIRQGLTGLVAIDPHPDMAQFHADLIDCYRNGVAVLDAEERGDGPGRADAELRTWQSFRGMIVTVRDLLAAHGCDPGEVEAIDNKFLVQIDAEIETLKRVTGS